MRPALWLCCWLVTTSGCGSMTSTSRPIVFDCASEKCRDCAVLATKLRWDAETRGLCQSCQGAAMPASSACANFPSENGTIVVQGCNDDQGCAGLSASCARYTGFPRNTCVMSDAK